MTHERCYISQTYVQRKFPVNIAIINDLTKCDRHCCMLFTNESTITNFLFDDFVKTFLFTVKNRIQSPSYHRSGKNWSVNQRLNDFISKKSFVKNFGRCQ